MHANTFQLVITKQIDNNHGHAQSHVLTCTYMHRMYLAQLSTFRCTHNNEQVILTLMTKMKTATMHAFPTHRCH